MAPTWLEFDDVDFYFTKMTAEPTYHPENILLKFLRSMRIEPWRGDKKVRSSFEFDSINVRIVRFENSSIRNWLVRSSINVR